MFKQINNWHLSILVAIVSVLSIGLIQQYAIAAWQEPTSIPGNPITQNIVVNPMTASLDLNDQSLVGDNVIIDPDGSNALSIGNSANLCLNGDCRAAWPAEGDPAIWNTNAQGIDYVSGNVGIGTASPAQLLQVSGGNILLDNNWSIKQKTAGGSDPSVFYLDSSDVLNLAGNDVNFKDLSGNSLAYLDDMGSVGYLGIGTSNPNRSLHIKTNSGLNAEIDIQTASNNYWGIYQDESTADLRFWNQSNRVAFTDNGRVGIGIDNPTSLLHVDSTDENITSILAKSDTAGTYALSAENTGTYGSAMYASGYYGLITMSNQANGYGLLSMKGTGSYAGMFFGDVRIQNSSGNSYLHLAVVSTAPPSTDCDSTDERGRMIYNYVDDYLYICDYDPANPSGGGWKYDIQESVP